MKAKKTTKKAAAKKVVVKDLGASRGGVKGGAFDTYLKIEGCPGQ